MSRQFDQLVVGFELHSMIIGFVLVDRIFTLTGMENSSSTSKKTEKISSNQADANLRITPIIVVFFEIKSSNDVRVSGFFAHFNFFSRVILARRNIQFLFSYLIRSPRKAASMLCFVSLSNLFYILSTVCCLYFVYNV